MWNFLYPLTSLPTIKYETPKTDRYLSYFSSKIISRNCPAVGWVRGESFQVYVYIEILHVIHMTLNYCIIFRKSKNPSEHKSIIFNMVSAYHSYIRKYGPLPA